MEGAAGVTTVLEIQRRGRGGHEASKQCWELSLLARLPWVCAVDEVNEGDVTATRVSSDGSPLIDGWGMNLKFMCEHCTQVGGGDVRGMLFRMVFSLNPGSREQPTRKQKSASAGRIGKAER